VRCASGEPGDHDAVGLRRVLQRNQRRGQAGPVGGAGGAGDALVALPPDNAVPGSARPRADRPLLHLEPEPVELGVGMITNTRYEINTPRRPQITSRRPGHE
jgi:hypothetical protein